MQAHRQRSTRFKNTCERNNQMHVTQVGLAEQEEVKSHVLNYTSFYCTAFYDRQAPAPPFSKNTTMLRTDAIKTMSK